MRFAQHGDAVAVQKGDHLAVHLVGDAAVVFEVAGSHLHVRACLSQRLAVVARFELCKLFGALQNDGGHFQHDPPALSGGELAPRPVQGPAGSSLHGLLDIRGRAARDMREWLAGARRNDRDGRAIGSGDPLAIDQQLEGRRVDCSRVHMRGLRVSRPARAAAGHR
jgi:hypothetical protein